MGKESNAILGLLAGTAIGVTLGILFAPDKGANTRQRIAEETAHARDTMSEGAHNLKDKISSTVSNKKENLDDQLESLVSNVSHKTEDVITSLEKKLSEMKSKNKKFQKS
ncbi:YtxH domain-containing protein [Bizionia argentinensis JUB59]|uniref:YtxH domain-containing protein n=1 Tax=Bizionia argentinensis JUB59 TaxID=1046627 RepID=G2EB34_9FLAO|nr:YtxH domain-containing protein [Bizionia argentinensis]EGV44286.1 YtxH domain-containing protein [Bizionia argentinensis JUB59]